MVPFLESLAREAAGMPLEVLLTGRSDDVPGALREACAARGAALRFLPPGGGAVLRYGDWARAVHAAEADVLWHADRHTRFLSEDALRHTLREMEAQDADMLHFTVPRGQSPQPDGLEGAAIAAYFLRGVLSPVGLVNKLFARGLCRSAVAELRRMGSTDEAAGECFLFLLVSAGARRCAGFSREIASWDAGGPGEEDPLRLGARQAAALYAALRALPDALSRMGHSGDLAALACRRVGAEFALSLGRTLRRSNKEAAEDLAARALRSAFGEERILLNALVLGMAANAEKLRAVYNAVYGDTAFDPDPAWWSGRKDFGFPASK
jgi:hypothetical protein